MTPLLSRLSALVAKTETTKGTAISLSSSDGIYNVYDVDVQPDISLVERPQQGTANLLPGIPGEYRGTAKFRLDLGGSGATGAVPLWASTFLPACGYAESGGVFTRTLAPANQTTLTIGHFVNGVKKTLAGAMGKFSIVCRNGKPADILFDFMGKYWAEADASLLTPSYVSAPPPRGYDTFTWNSYAIGGPEATFDAGQVVSLIEDKNDTNKTGFLHAIVTDFRATMKTSPYAELLATRDWHTDFLASTEAAMSCVVGTASNNTITLASAKAQIASDPWGERAGMRTRELSFSFNDGFTVAFT